MTARPEELARLPTFEMRKLLSFEQAEAIAALQARVSEMEGALNFYAAKENWETEDGDWEAAEQIADTATDDELCAMGIISPIEADGGQVARAALNTTEGGEG